MTTNTVHLGLVGKTTTVSEELARKLAGYQFILDGDSYTVWGEKIGTEGAEGTTDLHVIWQVCNGEITKKMAMDVRHLLVKTVGKEFRVIDYVVVTDREDWSENVEVHGAYA